MYMYLNPVFKNGSFLLLPVRAAHREQNRITCKGPRETKKKRSILRKKTWARCRFFWDHLSEHSREWRCGRDRERLAGSHEFKAKTLSNGKGVLQSVGWDQSVGEKLRLQEKPHSGSADGASLRAKNRAVQRTRGSGPGCWESAFSPGKGRNPGQQEPGVFYRAAQAWTRAWTTQAPGEGKPSCWFRLSCQCALATSRCCLRPNINKLAKPNNKSHPPLELGKTLCQMKSFDHFRKI